MLPEEVGVKFRLSNEWMIDPSSRDVDLRFSSDILRRSCKLDRVICHDCLRHPPLLHFYIVAFFSPLINLEKLILLCFQYIYIYIYISLKIIV